MNARAAARSVLRTGAKHRGAYALCVGCPDVVLCVGGLQGRKHTAPRQGNQRITHKHLDVSPRFEEPSGPRPWHSFNVSAWKMSARFLEAGLSKARATQHGVPRAVPRQLARHDLDLRNGRVAAVPGVVLG